MSPVVRPREVVDWKRSGVEPLRPASQWREIMVHTEKDQAPSDVAVPARPAPALFATIHFRSPERPGGFTEKEIVTLNERLNEPMDGGR